MLCCIIEKQKYDCFAIPKVAYQFCIYKEEILLSLQRKAKLRKAGILGKFSFANNK